LLGLWVRIRRGHGYLSLVECCVLSGRGLCDGLITRLGESYRLWCVVEFDLETSKMKRLWPALGHSATKGGGEIYNISANCLLILLLPKCEGRNKKEERKETDREYFVHPLKYCIFMQISEDRKFPIHLSVPFQRFSKMCLC
jgi:hypothetical protein